MWKLLVKDFFLSYKLSANNLIKKNFCVYITNTPSCLWNRLCWTLIIATLNIHTCSFVDESVFLSEYFLKILVRSTEVRFKRKTNQDLSYNVDTSNIKRIKDEIKCEKELFHENKLEQILENLNVKQGTFSM